MNAQLCWVSEQALEPQCDRTEVSVQLTLRPVLAEHLGSPGRGDSGPGCSTRNLNGVIGFSQPRGMRVWRRVMFLKPVHFHSVYTGKSQWHGPMYVCTHERREGTGRWAVGSGHRHRLWPLLRGCITHHAANSCPEASQVSILIIL